MLRISGKIIRTLHCSIECQQIPHLVLIQLAEHIVALGSVRENGGRVGNGREVDHKQFWGISPVKSRSRQLDRK
jgi:hypothetical protein